LAPPVTLDLAFHDGARVSQDGKPDLANEKGPCQQERPPRNLAMKPLEGIKVIELARILAGPWAGQLLADLGADVIKVERTGEGDDTRAWGPPFVIGANGENRDAAYFHACNRGKRSIAVDFANEQGQEIARKLCAGADVVIENFRVGALAKFGLDYVSLAKANPRLIHCSITGFGANGPYAAKAGYDFVVQAMGGIMHLTGEPDGPPEKAGVANADIFTGLYAVVAIQAALLRRTATGMGAQIDMALLDTQVGVLANQALNFLTTGVSPRRMGNAHPNLVPYQVFEAADGPLVIAVGNDRQNADLCKLLGKTDLASDPRFATNRARVANRADFIAALSQAVALWPRAELIAALEALGVPTGPINALDAVFNDPQVVARGMKITRSGVPGVRSPIIIDGQCASADIGAPILGQDTDAILRDLGASEAEISQWRATKAVQ